MAVFYVLRVSIASPTARWKHSLQAAKCEPCGLQLVSMSSANDLTARCAVCQADEIVNHCRDVHDTRVSGTWTTGTWPTTCSLLSQPSNSVQTDSQVLSRVSRQKSQSLSLRPLKSGEWAASTFQVEMGRNVFFNPTFIRSLWFESHSHSRSQIYNVIFPLPSKFQVP